MLDVNSPLSIKSLEGSSVLSGFKRLGDKAEATVVHEYISCRKENGQRDLNRMRQLHNYILVRSLEKGRWRRRMGGLSLIFTAVFFSASQTS